MKDKIIIHNHTDLPDYAVLEYIKIVTLQGKISERNKVNNVINRMAEEFEQTCESINEEYAVDEMFLDKEKIKEYFLNKQEEN